MVPERNVGRRAVLSAGLLTCVSSFSGCTGTLSGLFPSVEIEWETSVANASGSMAVTDDAAYVCTDDGLIALDADSGVKRWTFGRSGRARGRPLVSEGTIYYGTIGTANVGPAVYAIDAEGEEIWKVDLPGGGTSCAISGETVYAASGVMGGDRGLYAFDARSGDEEWTIPLAGHPIGSSPAIEDGVIYVESGGFAAFDAEDGTLRWRKEREKTEVGESQRRAPAVGDDVVYFNHSLEPNVSAIDATAGEERWSVETDGRPSNPVLEDDTVYVGTDRERSGSGPNRGTLYALDGETGDEEWTISTLSIGLSGPTVSDGTVYAAGHDTLHAIDSATGERDWEYEFDGWIRDPVVHDDRIYLIGRADSGSSTAVYSVRVS